MSRAKFEAARELIQQKNYSAARAILETMPDEPRAFEWLAKLDQVAPVKNTTPAKSKTPGCLLALALVVVVVVGGVFAARQYLPFSLPIIGCEYSQGDQRLVSDFLDQSKTAMSVSRISIGSLIVALQKVQSDFKNGTHPACATAVTEKINKGMDQTVEALQQFAANNNTMSAVYLDMAAEEFAKARDICFASNVYCPDSRLFEVNLLVWGRTPLTRPTATAGDSKPGARQ